MPFLALAMTLTLASCQVKKLDSLVFKCSVDAECGSGLKCLEGLCRSPSTAVSGTCEADCGATRSLCCGTACVDPATDTRNCGACGKACALGETCAGGTCLKEICDNAADDNADGLTDCADGIACPTGTACRSGSCCQGECAMESTPALCSDGVDNDCDGLADCADPQCLGQQCRTGKVCLGPGACAAGCFIDNEARLPGVAKEDAPCFACVPATSTTVWSPVARGQTSASCRDLRRCDGAGSCRLTSGQVCSGGQDCASGSCSEGVCQ